MINEGMETEADLSMEGINVGAVIMDMQANLLGSIGSRENLKDSMILQIKIFKALNIPLCLTEQVPESLGQPYQRFQALVPEIQYLTKILFPLLAAVNLIIGSKVIA